MAGLLWKGLGRVIGATLVTATFYLWVIAIIAILEMLGL